MLKWRPLTVKYCVQTVDSCLYFVVGLFAVIDWCSWMLPGSQEVMHGDVASQSEQTASCSNSMR